MAKRGRKPSSSVPRHPYQNKLAADVIAIIRAQPSQAEFLERIVRESARFDASVEVEKQAELQPVMTASLGYTVV